MKTLLLLRHAEAGLAGPGLGDHERLLTQRGRRQAEAQGRWLARHGPRPTAVLCSSAARTRDTAQLLISAANWTVELQAQSALYDASVIDLLDAVRAVDEEVDTLLLVGHAPSVPALVSALVTRDDDLALACEPATLFRIECDCGRWPQVGPRTGTLSLLLPA